MLEARLYPHEPRIRWDHADINGLLLWATNSGMSDLCLRSGLPAWIRLNGVWQQATRRAISADELLGALERLTRNNSVAALIRSGQSDYDFAHQIEETRGVRRRYRGNATPVADGYATGVKIVFRAIPNEFVERFIACSGVPVEHYRGEACFLTNRDVIKMPYPEYFVGTDEYYASKLHEFFHATGHRTREQRHRDPPTIRDYAFEEMRAEMFSMLAGAKLDLPMPESKSSAYISHWNRIFSGGDARAVFQAASEAAKILSVLHQFEMGEEPGPRWFPKRTEWPELIEMQQQRDAASGVSFRENESGVQVLADVERPAPPTFMEAAAVFRDTDNPALKARAILRNPDFLEMALGEDPASVMELAALCDRMAQVLHMELDEKLRTAPGAVENPVPLNEQQAASAQRMRI